MELAPAGAVELVRAVAAVVLGIDSMEHLHRNLIKEGQISIISPASDLQISNLIDTNAL